MQVYLPEALYKSVKQHGLHASELLQVAVVAEVRRRELLANTDRYLKDLVKKVGEPTAAERGKARAVAARIRQRATARTVRKVG